MYAEIQKCRGVGANPAAARGALCGGICTRLGGHIGGGPRKLWWGEIGGGGGQKKKVAGRFIRLLLLIRRQSRRTCLRLPESPPTVGAKAAVGEIGGDSGQKQNSGGALHPTAVDTLPESPYLPATAREPADGGRDSRGGAKS
ncbi:hypothetical protein B0H11DRAFT_1939801 [Mycena galericulata]|nr:hypothetical protein B0H11DRAFT_1939801 [Mycena galericulata]